MEIFPLSQQRAARVQFNLRFLFGLTAIAGLALVAPVADLLQCMLPLSILAGAFFAAYRSAQSARWLSLGCYAATVLWFWTLYLIAFKYLWWQPPVQCQPGPTPLHDLFLCYPLELIALAIVSGYRGYKDACARFLCIAAIPITTYFVSMQIDQWLHSPDLPY
jgi:hypothetical protein